MRRRRAFALGTALWLGAGLVPAHAATVTTSLVCTKAGVIQTAADVMAANTRTHATASDYRWSPSSVREVRLRSTLVISRAGTYRLRGTIANGQVVVNVNGNGVVRLILAGVSISSSKAAAIDVVAAPKVVVVLQAGSRNTLTDGATRAASDSASSALYSRAPLSVSGTGVLRVNGRHGDAIAGNDGVVITGGAISVTAKDDGIRGRDFVHITGGTISVKAIADGIRSTGKKASTVGYVYIGGGKVTVDAQAAGLHGISDVVIAGGTVRLAAVGDGITSSCVSYLERATVSIAAGKKAMHSNGETVVRSGVLNVTKAVEGLEGRAVSVRGGTLTLKTADDGINVTPGAPSATPTTYSNSVEPAFDMRGGSVVIDALGDGIDLNGKGMLSGGRLFINGPTATKDGALDTMDALVATGGLILGVGAAAFASAPTTTSPQASMLANLASTQPAGSALLIVDASGRVLAGFKAVRPWQSVVFTSSQLAKGQAYKLYVGGKLSGTPIGSYYPSGSTQGATLVGTFAAGQYTNPTPVP